MTDMEAALQMDLGARAVLGAPSMRFCSQQTLHTNALLRTSKAQMEARSSRRCSTWRNVSQVSEKPRLSVAIGEKVQPRGECPGRCVPR